MVALLQLLAGALALQWRQLDDAGGMSGGAGGVRSGRSGEEEVAGVYGDVGDAAVASETGGSGNPARALQELSRPEHREVSCFPMMCCSIDSQCLALLALAALWTLLTSAALRSDVRDVSRYVGHRDCMHGRLFQLAGAKVPQGRRHLQERRQLQGRQGEEIGSVGQFC